MDSAGTMLPTMEETLPFTEECEFDNTALTKLYNFQRANNPRLQGMSNRDIAEECDMSENTLCALLKGKNKNPRIGTLKRLIRVIGGGSIDRLVGFAPHRNFETESAVYDATLVESLQARLDDKRAQIEDLKSQLEDSNARLVNLRTIIHEEGKAGNSAQGQLKEMEQRLADKREQIERNEKLISEQRAEIRVLRRWNNGLLAALVALVVVVAVLYLLWEVRNPDKGLSGLIRTLIQ